MKKYLVLLFLSTALFAQNNKQTIRGTATDKLSQTPLIGATVQITTSNKQTVTDEKGNYTRLKFRLWAIKK